MRQFLVNVNGTKYEVAVEEIDPKQAAAAPVQAAPAPVAAPVAAPAPAKAKAAGGTPVNSPMPGTINAINVKEGDAVKVGQAIFVLESMKMESDIASPVAGTILSVEVTKGSSVDTGALLCVIG